MSGRFQEAFEDHFADLVGVAFWVTDQNPRVTEVILVVGIDVDEGVGIPIYRVDGTLMQLFQLQAAGIVDEDPQEEILMALNDLVESMIAAVDDPEELPTVIVIRYDVATSDANAEFSYEPWQPGVPEEDRPTVTYLANELADTFTETGNFTVPVD